MTILASDVFSAWIEALKDNVARVRIAHRLRRLGEGHAGDSKAVGDGVFELRLHFGPGYRIYFLRRGDTLIVLLCGGDKSTQSRDIARAKQMAAEWSTKR